MLGVARASSESASEASLGGVPSLLRHREAVKKQLVQAEQFSGLFARGQRQIAAHSGPSTNSADLCRELAIIRSHLAVAGALGRWRRWARVEHASRLGGSVTPALRQPSPAAAVVSDWRQAAALRRAVRWQTVLRAWRAWRARLDERARHAATAAAVGAAVDRRRRQLSIVAWAKAAAAATREAARTREAEAVSYTHLTLPTTPYV